MILESYFLEIQRSSSSNVVTYEQNPSFFRQVMLKYDTVLQISQTEFLRDAAESLPTLNSGKH